MKDDELDPHIAALSASLTGQSCLSSSLSLFHLQHPVWSGSMGPGWSQRVSTPHTHWIFFFGPGCEPEVGFYCSTIFFVYADISFFGHGSLLESMNMSAICT